MPETPWWDREYPVPATAFTKARVVVTQVDNRMFLLGLDQMYREAMKPHERGELLKRANDVAALKAGKDPLSQALTRVEWTIALLMAEAARIARDTDDFSLAGLAARAEDPVVIAALRESTVLHAKPTTMSARPVIRYEFEWAVTPDLAAAAKRFVDEFNRVVGPSIPQPIAARAWVFAQAAQNAHVAGLCLRLGQSPDGARFYHWAIAGAAEGGLAVHEFWDEKVWTTEMYKHRDAGPEARISRATQGRRTEDFR